MKFIYTATLTLLLAISTTAQTSYDELDLELDSTTTPYKPTSKNYVLIKSKRGTSGVNKTPQADAILSMEVNEIVLVFTENEPGDLAEREDANRERWENLLLTYPELFQFSTTYKSICQCKLGDEPGFKKSQGFYVYVNGAVPKVEEPKEEEEVAEAPKKETPVAKTEKPVEKPNQQEVAVEKPTEKKPEKVNETPAEEKPVVKEMPRQDKSVGEAETPANNNPEPVAETKPKKKPNVAANKPRKAKDPKACRQPCYGYGDEDLLAFFKDNITLSKKQKKKAKSVVVNVRLQLNPDGSIKKAMITGQSEPYNKLVDDAVKGMKNWNAAVKNGVAVKSEVKFNLKYDKASKAFRPQDFLINPRLAPKCSCVPDSEIFGD